MDNEGKVTDLVEQSKLAFLREALEDFKREQAQYDLGREFANSRKNRSMLVPGVIIGVVLLVWCARQPVSMPAQDKKKPSPPVEKTA